MGLFQLPLRFGRARAPLRRESGVSWLAVIELKSMLAGLAAGAVFLVVSVLASIIAAGSPAAGPGASAYPFRLAASVLLHDAQVNSIPIWLALTLGSAVHFGLSAIFGFLYGLVMTDENGRHRGSTGYQAAIGMALGLAVYLVDVQLIARFWYSWFLAPNQLVVALLHVIGFGLPLGLLAPLVDRRANQMTTPSQRESQQVG